MTSVTRSARRVKNGDNRSSKIVSSGGRLKVSKNSTASGSATTDTSTLRRSARKASSKKQQLKQQLLRPSLNSKRPEKVENRAPSPPLSKWKLVCLEKPSTSSPSERYERWERRQVLKGCDAQISDRASCSSSSKKSEKSPSSTGTKKSEKSYSTSAVKKSKERVENGEDRATTADDWSKIEKVGTRNASTPLKKKKLDAHTYRTPLGPQPKKLKQSALNHSSRENGNVSKRDTENLATCLLEEEEEGVDDCSGRKEGLLEQKHSEEGSEETIEASSSTPRKLVYGTSRNDGDGVEVTTFSRKRKFCYNKVHGPDFRESQSEDSDRTLQVSPAEYMVMEKKNLEKAVDSVESAKMVCPMQEGQAIPQVIMITSSDGKPPTAEYEVVEGPAVGQSKKLSAPNLDSDTSGTVAKSAAWSGKNSSDGISLSTSSRNSGRLSDVCLACTNPEGVVNDSQIQEVCSCNVKKNCEAYEVSDFKTISGSGGIWDILDGYVRQRYGQDSYERVDSGLVPLKRQLALNIFNNLETGSFMFLLENHACRSSIKFSSVDTVIIFDSDWNPVIDLRALLKIYIDSRTDQLKVFHLYSPFTVEEKALILANKDTSLESNVQNITHTASHMLPIWGASYLFDKLDEFHFYKSSSTDSKKFSYDDMVRDILAALQNDGKIEKPSDVCSLMSKVHHSGAMYSPTSFLLGEREMLVTDDGPPSVFWTKLLNKRFPSWRYLPEAFQRPRKKAKYADSLSEKVEADNDELTRKCHEVVHCTIVDPITLQPWIEEQKQKAVSGGKEAKVSDAAFSSLTRPQSDSCTHKEKPGILGARAENAEHPLPKPLNLSNDLSSDTSKVSELHMVESESCRKLRDAQKSLHRLLKPEISKLCETLELPEEVMHMTAKFLEYIMNNHHVNKEPKTILQAFMISLCWRTASLMKYKVNHKESLLRVKQIMEFECKEEEAESVYKKLRQPKEKFSHQMNWVRNFTKLNSLENQATSPSNPSQAMNLESVASDPPCLAGEARGSPSSYSHSVYTVPWEHEIPPLKLVKPDLERQGCNHMQSATSSFGAGSENKTSIEQLCGQVVETFSRRKKEILERQKKEILEFKKHKIEVKEKMRRDHRLEVDSIRATYANYSQRLDNLKLLIEKFSKKMKELDKHIDTCYKELVLMQYKARQKEDSMKAICLVKANSGRLPVSLEKIPLSETGFDIECMKTTEQSEVRNLENMLPSLDSVPESQDVVVKVDSRSAELLVPTALPTTTSAPTQDENDGMNMRHSESITATAVGPLNQENLEGTSLGASSQVDNIPPSSQADYIYKAKPSTDSCHNDPVLFHEVPSVEPNQPPTSAAVVESVEIQIPNVTSFQMCGSSVPIPQPIESSEVDDSLMTINELQQNNDVSCSSEQIVVQRREPNTCPTLPAKQLNHSDRLLAAPNSRRAGTLPDPSVLPGPSFCSPPIHPSAVGRPQLYHPDPLQNELAKIGRDKDVATRTHEEEKSQLVSQCEKEIEEIHRKYNGLIQEMEMRLNQKLVVLDSHYNKVYMNRILAEVCKFKYELRPPVHLRQGTLSSASVQQYPRPFSQPVVSQTAQMLPRVPGSAPPFQVRHTAALLPGNPVSTKYPSVVPRAFPQGSAEVRAPPPHLHPLRSAAFPSPKDGQLPLSSVIATQHSSADVPPTSTSSSQSPTSYPSSGPAVTHLTDDPVMFQPNRNSSLELLKGIHSRIGLNPVFQQPFAPNAGATLDAPELSQDRRPSPAVADANDATAAANLICLSDDD